MSDLRNNSILGALLASALGVMAIGVGAQALVQPNYPEKPGFLPVVAETPGANSNLMRQWIDQLRKKGGSLAVLLAAGQGDDKVTLVAGVTRDLVDKGVSAGNWVRDVAPVVGGGGGGKPDMAQAGGKSPEKLSEALETARQVIRTMLAA